MPAIDIAEVLDLDRYPLHAPGAEAHAALVARCKADLEREGMFNLVGLVMPDALEMAVGEVRPHFADAFFHNRRHNIYFRKAADLAADLPSGHPALTEFDTRNHTVCADRIAGGVIDAVYSWAPFRAFLAEVMEKPELHLMADPLARLNVMSYTDGEALNWHFDRSEFTTTLLLQAPEAGGDFEYRTGLRTEDDPNYDGVARLVRGEDPGVKLLKLAPGTLNVFRGKNTAHRVTPVKGARERIIAVFSYYERPGVMFSEEERVGFYGRAA